MYKLSVVSEEHGISFNGRYENLSRADKPEIVAKALDGTVVKTTTVYNNQPLPAGSTTKKWMDPAGKEYSKTELKFYLGEQEVSEVEQTKVLNIEGFQPLENYTDTYVISTYYELSPDDNGMKKDIDKQRAMAANLAQMHKLWKHLHENHVVARGEFSPATRGFVVSDGYIRAIQIGKKWGLEIGVFKEVKRFEHLNEGTPAEIVIAPETKAKRVKMI